MTSAFLTKDSQNSSFKALYPASCKTIRKTITVCMSPDQDFNSTKLHKDCICAKDQYLCLSSKKKKKVVWFSGMSGHASFAKLTNSVLAVAEGS